jgi:FAD dependent oxidoreductase TIGR03364
MMAPTLARQADVLVVGTGVLGTFHAYFAALKGYKVLLVERNAFPSDASTRNFGMIAQSIVPIGGLWSGYARDSAEIYRALQREHDIGARTSGSLYVAATELERRVLDEFARLYGTDYTCAYLDAAEARYRYPFIQASYCAGALLFPDDLTLEPRRMLRQLIPYLTRQGLLDYAPHTTVISVERSGQGCLVRDARNNSYAADRVIVCGGADCATLFPTLLEESGLRLCKLQMMRTVPQGNFTLPHALLSGLSIRRYPAFASCPSYASLLDEPVDATLRDKGIHLLFKQRPDGSVVVGDSHAYVDVRDAALLAELTNPAIDAAVLGYGRRMCALPSWDIQERWNGYYLTHPAQEVYTETIDGVIHIVTGIGGKGMTTGPGYARAHIDAILP